MAMVESGTGDTPANEEVTASIATLACERCKRRKIKCDRTPPSCGPCKKVSSTCVYPTSSQKPGPKPGAPQRRRVRRVNGSEYSRPYPSPVSSRHSHTLATAVTDPVATSIVHNAEPSNSSFDRLVSVAAIRHFDAPFDNPFHSTQTSPQASVLSHETEKGSLRGPTLSNLLSVSHDPVPNSEPHVLDSDQMVGQWRGLEAVCADLEISIDIYHYLLSAYFENMIAFSLFHQPTFDIKVSSITSPIQQRALLASIFAFSARFTEIGSSRTTGFSNIPSHEHFRKIAQESVDQALRDCWDDSPPLCLLQALILTTFQQLTNGVRGHSWRAIHTCVSIAYDLHLHLVDKNVAKRTTNDAHSYLLEEKRRAWWVLWEFDVFASTIRKLPTAIDWLNNETWLPIDDELWFNNAVARSCTLSPDPAVAWKELEMTGSRSAKAWFIVINALMRCAHIMAFPHVYSNNHSGGDILSGTDAVQSAKSDLDVLGNSLYCLSSAMPDNLAYNGEFLNFSTRSSLQDDSAKLSICIMTQLSRLCLHQLRVFSSTYRQLGVVDTSSSSDHCEDSTPSSTLNSLDRAAWNVYLAAASEIVHVVRNSSPKHVRYVNPFLSSTIWTAAAAQIVSRKIGPHLVNPRVADSNFDLLQMNLDCYVSFWGVSKSLQQKLKVLAARLESVRTQVAASNNPGLQEPQTQRSTNWGVNQMQRPVPTNNGMQYGDNVPTQYPVANQPASIRPMNISDGSVLADWSAPQASNFGDALAVPNLESNDMWSYDLDELLMYGGFE